MSTADTEPSARTGDMPATESRGSLTPLLPGAFPQSRSTAEQDATVEGDNSAKSSKRTFWDKLGGKKEAEKTKPRSLTQPTTKATPAQASQVTALRPVSPLHATTAARASTSPSRGHPYGSAVSPGLAGFSSSPRIHSPASSQIFERNVQEEVLPAQASPHLPSHIITENHIPPALDASSAAITNEKLNPDEVEIVTSNTHQPAAVTITGAGLEQSMSSSFHGDSYDFSQHHRHALNDDNASNYGTLDSADVRRLSFVSFADVVHAEHAEHAEHEGAGGEPGSHRGSMAMSGMTGHPSIGPPRSPSPVRSPVSSHGLGTSPPSSVSASVKGFETSPSRGGRGPGSPLTAQSPPLGGDLNVETMRQALRKTGSGDLSGSRSQPMSAVGDNEGAYQDRPFDRPLK